MSYEWTPTLLAIHNAIITMGSFQEPMEESLVGLTLNGWQLEQAKRILAAVENQQAREENIHLNEPPGEKKERVRGWNYILSAVGRSPAKWHYFMESGDSLCGHWFLWSNNSDGQDDNDDSPDNCKMCQKKLKKLREKESGTDKTAVDIGG